MPTLPSGGTIWVDNRSATSARAMRFRETSPTVFELVGAGPADLELVDVAGDGVFDAVAAGTAPSAARIVARQLAGGNIIVY